MNRRPVEITEISGPPGQYQLNVGLWESIAIGRPPMKTRAPLAMLGKEEHLLGKAKYETTIDFLSLGHCAWRL